MQLNNITSQQYSYFHHLGIIGGKNIILPPILSKGMEAIGEDVPEKIRLTMVLAELGGLVSGLNNKVELPHIDSKGKQQGATLVPCNQQMYLIASSGASKDKSIGIIRNAVSDASKILLTRISKSSIIQAKTACKADGKPEALWKKYYNEITDLYPSISTERGVVKYMANLSDLGIGSANIYSSELGTALSNKADMFEMLDVLSIGYDLGNVPRKLVATQELQISDVKGVPINSTMFSSIETILRSPASKEKFIALTETQLARRGTFAYSTKELKALDFKTLEEADKYVFQSGVASTEAVKFIRLATTEVMAKLPAKGVIKLGDNVLRDFNRYLSLNKERARAIDVADSFRILSTRHAQWRALKLSGLIAQLLGKTTVSLKMFHSAISIIEYYIDDIDRIQQELSREPYEYFVEHCRLRAAKSGAYSVSKHQLNKYKFVSTMSDKSIQELVDAANSYSKDGVFIYQKKLLKIMYKQVEKKTYIKREELPVNVKKGTRPSQPTDKLITHINKYGPIKPQKGTVSKPAPIKASIDDPEDINPLLKPREVSVNVAEAVEKVPKFNMSLLPFDKGLSKDQKMGRAHKGFKAVSGMSWHELAERTVQSCAAYTPYWYKSGKRSLDNLRGTTNLLVLDVDDTKVAMKNMSQLLGQYNHIIATTSDKTNEFKYRIIMELDNKIDLTPKQWKVFYKSVADSLGIEVDRNIGKSGIFFGYDDAECIVVDGVGKFRTRDHVLEAYQQASEYTEEPVEILEEGDQKALDALWDDRYNKFEFAYESDKGSRSSMIIAAMHKAKRMNMPKDIIKELLWDINDAIVVGGISKTRMETTVFSQL